MLYDPNWKPKETEVELETWQKILIRAAKILETHGWCRGALQKGGSFCTVGAMGQATGELKGKIAFRHGEWDSTSCLHSDPDYRRAQNELQKIIPHNRSIPDWNDSCVSDKRKVIRTLHKAAGVK